MVTKFFVAVGVLSVVYFGAPYVYAIVHFFGAVKKGLGV